MNVTIYHLSMCTDAQGSYLLIHNYVHILPLDKNKGFKKFDFS